jgi:hypothetical protein
MLTTCEKRPSSATSNVICLKCLTIVLALLCVFPIVTVTQAVGTDQNSPRPLGSWSMCVAIEFISTARVRGAPRWSSWAQGSLSIGGSSNLKSQNLLRCVRMTIQESVGATKVRNLWGSGATTSQSKASDAWRLQTRSETGRNNGLEPT